MKTNILAPLVGSLLVSTLIVGCGESEPKLNDPASPEQTADFLSRLENDTGKYNFHDIRDFSCSYTLVHDPKNIEITCAFTAYSLPNTDGLKKEMKEYLLKKAPNRRLNRLVYFKQQDKDWIFAGSN